MAHKRTCQLALTNVRFGGKADMTLNAAQCPLMTHSGRHPTHSECSMPFDTMLPSDTGECVTWR